MTCGRSLIAGVGNGNQRLFVVPSEQLVVTVFAGGYNAFAPHSERILDRCLASDAPSAGGPVARKDLSGISSGTPDPAEVDSTG